MADQKIKTAAGKVPLNLVPLASLKGAARVFEYGCRKYAKGNWYTASDDEIGDRYFGGALRHLSDSQRPDGTYDFSSMAARDVESGLPEIDHMICGLLMLRGLLIKREALPADPGVGLDPVKVDPTAIDMRPHNPAACDCRDCESFRLTTTLPLEAQIEWNVPLSVPR